MVLLVGAPQGRSHAKPAEEDLPAFAPLAQSLPGASLSWRCYYTRYNRFADKRSGHGHVWSCDIRNDGDRSVAISIRIHGKEVTDPGDYFGRATIEAGEAHTFWDFTAAPPGAGVTMWWRKPCWGDPLECPEQPQPQGRTCVARTDTHFEPQLRGTTLPPGPTRVLREIARTAGCDAPKVTRFESSVEKQIEILYGVIRRQGRTLTAAQAKDCTRKGKVTHEGEVVALEEGPVDGLTAARCTYDIQSAPVFDAFAKHRRQGAKKTKTMMRAALHKVLEDLGDDRKTMMHVEGKNFAFDVAPSSLCGCEDRFRDAARSHPEVIHDRLFTPDDPAEAAYHLEVARPPAAEESPH